ncbi:MAG: hypothetical protein GX663_08965 [Clostridiales bacterium]|nr:hypothetical protein [Clostridiales bacterium]
MDTAFKVGITCAIAIVLFGILPISPFQDFISSMEQTPYLGYVNWFFPVGRCLTLLVAWGTAIGVFYGIQWILRQFDIIT